MSEIKPWIRKESRRLVDCRIFSVSESTSVCPRTQNEHQFFFIDTADWVNIVPVTSNNEVVFIRQFRHGSEQITLEIPGLWTSMSDGCGRRLRKIHRRQNTC